MTSTALSSTGAPANSPAKSNALSGTILMYGGVALLIVAGVERAGGIPFLLPNIYYANQPFWPFIGIAIALTGFTILKRETSLQWKASVRGQRFDAVVVYTREGCELCDEALDTLQKYSRYLPDSIEVDIDDEPELLERFNTCVPVVEFDGKIRFRGKVNEQLLRRLIEGTQPLENATQQVNVAVGGT